MLVNSVPLSETIVFGMPRSAITLSSSRASAVSGQRCISHQNQVLTTKVINDCQDAKPTTVCQSVRHEIQAPALVWAIRQHHRFPCAQSALSAASATHLKLLFTVDAPHFRVVHLKTFSGDHHVNTAATKPTAFTRHAFDCISQFHIITTARQISLPLTYQSAAHRL